MKGEVLESGIGVCSLTPVGMWFGGRGQNHFTNNRSTGQAESVSNHVESKGDGRPRGLQYVRLVWGTACERERSGGGEISIFQKVCVCQFG